MAGLAYVWNSVEEWVGKQIHLAIMTSGIAGVLALRSSGSGQSSLKTNEVQ